MADDFRALREQVCAANLALGASGLVIHTWGNVSGIDRDAGIVAIKPSGVPYGELTCEGIVLVSLATGSPLLDSLRPSSDLLTHLEIYRHFPAVGGVAHTHSPVATAFAQAHRELPCLGTTHADHFCGAVPVTRAMRRNETAIDYELNTGKVIVERFEQLDPTEVPAVLVASHGPFTWGRDAHAAVTNSVVLEACAVMVRDTFALNPDSSAIPAHLLERHFKRKHGPGAYYGQKG